LLSERFGQSLLATAGKHLTATNAKKSREDRKGYEIERRFSLTGTAMVLL